MNRSSASKAISSHPGVESCDFGPDVGVDDYKYSVFLKDGWVFSSGRMEGCRSGNFNTVLDFKYAEPVKAEKYAQLRAYRPVSKRA